MLPLFPVPLPFVPDDFSFLLASDTFAMGRLANPTPAMWTHFESIHISMIPTYGSMYFPATGLVFAAGKVLTGHPWFGLLVVTSLMCAAICWMLQAWLPPEWALLGGVLAILRLGLFSYWVNSYTGGALINGGASPAALGGALVLGAFPRLMRTVRLRDGLLLAVGISLLLLSRPYEGFLLCLPVAVALALWLFFRRRGPGQSAPPKGARLARLVALPLAIIISAGAWLAYYDYRAFGNPATLPYSVNRATYAVVPYFVWQPLRPQPIYRNHELQTFYTVNETESIAKSRTPLGFLRSVFDRVMVAVLFFAGFALFPAFITLHRAFKDRRTRFLAWSIAVLAVGMGIQIFLIPHYLAPFTAAFYALGLQAARHLRFWTPGGKPVGATLVRLTVVLCFLLAGMRLSAEPLHLKLSKWPPMDWIMWWYGPAHFGVERAQIQSKLESLPGKQLVLVRYGPGHNVLDEWVYNAPDIDSSKVIWAREMSSSENMEILNYYKDRKAWLVQPDATSDSLSPYRPPNLLPEK